MTRDPEIGTVKHPGEGPFAVRSQCLRPALPTSPQQHNFRVGPDEERRERCSPGSDLRSRGPPNRIHHLCQPRPWPTLPGMPFGNASATVGVTTLVTYAATSSDEAEVRFRQPEPKRNSQTILFKPQPQVNLDASHNAVPGELQTIRHSRAGLSTHPSGPGGQSTGENLRCGLLQRECRPSILSFASVTRSNIIGAASCIRIFHFNQTRRPNRPRNPS